MTRLDDTDRRRFTTEHPEWRLDDEVISRTFLFDGFAEALGFTVKVAMMAETANHHPDIDIRWNRVTLALTTHSEGRLTMRDVELAAAIDEVA